MQPDVQTTTRGSLAVSAGALEIAIVIQGAFPDFSFLPFAYSPFNFGVEHGIFS